MTIFVGDQFSLDDLETGPSPDGLPPFPDLNSATEQSADSGEESGQGPDGPDSSDEGATTEAQRPDGQDAQTREATSQGHGAQNFEAQNPEAADDSASTEGPAPQNEGLNDMEADAAGDDSEHDTNGTENLRGRAERGAPAAPTAGNAINDTDDSGGAGEAGGTETTDDRNDTNGSGDASARSGRKSGPSPECSSGIRQGYLSPRIFELVPDLLAGPAARIADRRKRDVFLTGALPVWAGALPSVRFRYGGNDLSPNLYSPTIAPPASGKSALRHARTYGAPLSDELRAGAPAAEAAPPSTPTDGSRPAPGDESNDRTPSSGAPDPASRRLFLAGDTSAAAIKESLAKSPHGVICETEFRTLSQALESSWGKFKDVLLKGFQNEPIKVNRSSKERVTISHPAPSIAIAGTPATFEGVISGTGDGLFSRFLLYRFDQEFEWSTQFNKNGTGPAQHLQEAAEDFQVGYHQLRAREEPLRVTVPERLRAVHNQAFRSLTEKWKDEEDVPRSLQASLTRAGLQAVKIATVLRGVRLIGSGAPLGTIQSVALRPDDMEAGLRLALTYLLHGIRVETRFREGAGPRANLTERKRGYLEALPEDTFSTQDAKALASTFNVSERNAQRWLKDWREAGLLTKPKRGRWAKLSPELGGIIGARSVISVINDIPAFPSSSSA
jgi:hypothetical protein